MDVKLSIRSEVATIWWMSLTAVSLSWTITFYKNKENKFLVLISPILYSATTPNNICNIFKWCINELWYRSYYSLNWRITLSNIFCNRSGCPLFLESAWVMFNHSMAQNSVWISILQREASQRTLLEKTLRVRFWIHNHL